MKVDHVRWAGLVLTVSGASTALAASQGYFQYWIAAAIPLTALPITLAWLGYQTGRGDPDGSRALLGGGIAAFLFLAAAFFYYAGPRWAAVQWPLVAVAVGVISYAKGRSEALEGKMQIAAENAPEANVPTTVPAAMPQ